MRMSKLFVLTLRDTPTEAGNRGGHDRPSISFASWFAPPAWFWELRFHPAGRADAAQD
jgi:hypothetical protein